MRSKKIRYTVASATIVIVFAASVGFSLLRAAPARVAADTIAMPAFGTSGGVMKARFAVLVDRHTNECALRAQDVNTLAVKGRLQGSCCTPMAFHHYEQQIRGLTAYRRVGQIPRDPYDIPVGQARQLLAYDKQIALAPAQQAIYKRAITLAHEHGPCCCRCWRWTAFEGQARYLTARQGWSASQVAKVWDLEDGCGG